MSFRAVAEKIEDGSRGLAVAACAGFAVTSVVWGLMSMDAAKEADSAVIWANYAAERARIDAESARIARVRIGGGAGRS